MLDMFPILALKHLGCHPRRAAFIVSHVGLNVTRSSKVTDLQHCAVSYQEEAKEEEDNGRYQSNTPF